MTIIVMMIIKDDECRWLVMTDDNWCWSYVNDKNDDHGDDDHKDYDWWLMMIRSDWRWLMVIIYEW